MSPSVRFEDEADAEYRDAGRWYEGRRAGLGLEFFDTVDTALDQIVLVPRAGARVPRLPADLPVRRAPVRRFPYHVIYLETQAAIRVLLSPTTGADRVTGRTDCKGRKRRELLLSVPGTWIWDLSEKILPWQPTPSRSG